LVVVVVVVVVLVVVVVVLVVVVVAFVLIVQELVELCERHQQMNIQEDLVEIELEQDELIVFLVEDNHKHVLELVPIV
jgi:predicted PurR-regulated permease PerM